MRSLIDNALKHSPEGSTAEDRPLIFDRFFRSAEEPALDGAGGLGLSVAKWVAEIHGGSVRLLDQGPGATFEVLLPAAPPPDRGDSG